MHTIFKKNIFYNPDFFYMQNSSIHLLQGQGVGTSQHLITDPKNLI